MEAPPPDDCEALREWGPWLRDLELLLRSDLGAEGYGLGFLRSEPARKILLSDHLLCAVNSVRTNLQEAGWSIDLLLTMNTAMASRAYRHQVNPEPDAVGHPMPTPTPAANWERIGRDAIIAGFFRALGSAMDNLGAAVAIICSRPVEVVGYFTWGTLMARGFQGKKGVALDGEGAFLKRWIDLAVEASGPPGWLTWTMAMRNMLVHRPRRLWLAMLDGERDESGDLVGLTDDIHLPVEPELTDIEMFRFTTMHQGVLREPATVSVRGALDGARRLVDAVAFYLDAVYRRDRSDGVEPQTRWRGGELTRWAPGMKNSSAAFDGFDPAAVMPEAGTMGLNPQDWQRLTSAAVDDAHRPLWVTWLAEAARSAKE